MNTKDIEEVVEKIYNKNPYRYRPIKGDDGLNEIRDALTTLQQHHQAEVEKVREAERERIIGIINSAKLDKVPHELKINPTAWLFADRIVEHTQRQLINTLTPTKTDKQPGDNYLQ